MSEVLDDDPPTYVAIPSMPGCADLEQVLAGVREIAVWVAAGGCRRDDAVFLLRSADGSWHSLAFNDPRIADLVCSMRALPGFDSDRLVDAVCTQTPRITVIWPTPH